PRDAHRVHRGLCTGDRHPDLVDPARQFLDELHGRDLVLRGQREADTLAHPLVDVVVDAVVAVAEDDRPVAHAQVDVLVAIDVPHAAALAPIDVDRVVAPGAKVRVGAARERAHRAPVHLALDVALQRGRGSGGRGLGGHVILVYGFGCPVHATIVAYGGTGRSHRATARAGPSTRITLVWTDVHTNRVPEGI